MYFIRNFIYKLKIIHLKEYMENFYKFNTKIVYTYLINIYIVKYKLCYIIKITILYRVIIDSY